MTIIRSPIIRNALWIFGALLTWAFITWAFVEKRKELAEELERDKPIAVPVRIKKNDKGEIQVILDTKTQTLAGVQVAQSSSGQNIIIPRSAILRDEGKTWIFVQVGAETFIRKEIFLLQPTNEGWRISSGVSPKDRLVTQGAQTLLSEELREQIKVGEEN